MGQHIHGTAAEWFAAGVTLHEFLTGRRPFEVQKLQVFRSFTHQSAELTNLESPLLPLDFLNDCNYLSETCKDFLHQVLHYKVRESRS